MASQRRFVQVDVFTLSPTAGYTGNPVAVVQDAQCLSTGQMQAFARWTNLSETTFLLPPTISGADYHVRIFTPKEELDFAGHPTLGTAHAWLALTGKEQDEIGQQCGVGLVRIKKIEGRLSLAAPPLRVDTEVEPILASRGLKACGCDAADVLASRLMNNGPQFHVFLLSSARAVLDLDPDFSTLTAVKAKSGWGFVGAYPDPQEHGTPDFECRMFFPETGVDEDPITGSFNAVAAQWLIGMGKAPKSYLAGQGTVIGRQGRVHVRTDNADQIWIGGETITCVEGQLY